MLPRTVSPPHFTGIRWSQRPIGCAPQNTHRGGSLPKNDTIWAISALPNLRRPNPSWIARFTNENPNAGVIRIGALGSFTFPPCMNSLIVLRVVHPPRRIVVQGPPEREEQSGAQGAVDQVLQRDWFALPQRPQGGRILSCQTDRPCFRHVVSPFDRLRPGPAWAVRMAASPPSVRRATRAGSSDYLLLVQRDGCV